VVWGRFAAHREQVRSYRDLRIPTLLDPIAIQNFRIPTLREPITIQNLRIPTLREPIADPVGAYEHREAAIGCAAVVKPTQDDEETPTCR